MRPGGRREELRKPGGGCLRLGQRVRSGRTVSRVGSGSALGGPGRRVGPGRGHLDTNTKNTTKKTDNKKNDRTIIRSTLLRVIIRRIIIGII